MTTGPAALTLALTLTLTILTVATCPTCDIDNENNNINSGCGYLGNWQLAMQMQYAATCNLTDTDTSYWHIDNGKCKYNNNKQISREISLAAGR
jgi:hypothetical protein